MREEGAESRVGPRPGNLRPREAPPRKNVSANFLNSLLISSERRDNFRRSRVSVLAA
jgi:hypothetical protein